jgi:hypothetical protein
VSKQIAPVTLRRRVLLPIRWFGFEITVEFVLAILIVVAALPIAACGRGVPSAHPTTIVRHDSGVEGRTLVTGGPAGSSPAPDPGAVVTVIQTAPDGRVVAKTVSDAAGRFRVYLPPGKYLLVVGNGISTQVPSGSPSPLPSVVPSATMRVTVQSGSFARATLLLQIP